MFKKKFPSLSSLGSDGNTAFLRAARAGHLDKVLEHLKSNIDINTSNSNGLNALHLASKDGHVNVVTELLKRGAVVDAATKKGNTALHIASLAGQEEVVKLLVANGAAVNVQSQNGFTPLYMAAQENHDNVVRFLLASGANQSLATEDGFTPLAVAMQQGHDKVVAVLLENDTRGKVRLPALHIAAKKDDCKAAALLLQNDHNPDVTSKSGFTPLHIAAHYGNESIANLLLNRGADVNYSAKHNITPLHVAAKWGKTNMVSLLLEKGANIESKTRDGLTPLHCAARSGHEQVVDMMLERGAPISSKTKNGLAPLHMASQGDHVDAARILLYHRAPVDEVTVDYLTALHVAAHCGHVRVAKLLLDRKADPNARALNGFTPLHIACKKNRIKVVELLLKHGASIEATTESGLTPLHVASFMGCMNIVIYLLQHDASPDVPTVRGETPLHLAARANQTDIIRILLRNGAQVDARAREQQTPLHIASRLGNVDIVMLLLQHGAAVDSTTKDMYTALHIAGKEGQEEVASVLLEHGGSLTATTKKGFTPLHLAAKYGNMKVAKLLLQRDAPVDAQGKNGVTPLHVASHYDHQNVALLLLDKGASPHATAKNGHTPLHIAARKNQMDIATTLLEYGAKADAESKAGFTPLHLSSQEGHTDMSTLLIEHQADTNHKAKNGLTPLHLCAQEDRVNVASVLVKNGAEVDSITKAGYTPLHVASHFGQINMVRFLLQHGANVKACTSIGYTPLHQAAQQGHTSIINLLLENSAPPNSLTNQGQTALSIAQKLGYISVVESLKTVTEPSIPTNVAPGAEEKYRVVAPETMQETFMSDSEDEGGEDTMLSDQPYRYLTVDEMKSLGDDSLPIDVTRDERIDSNRECMAPPTAVDDTISPQHAKESYAHFTATNYTPDNIDINRHPVHVGKLHWKNFLVSFLVDARGGAMRGCRHSGVRVIVPPRKAAMPMRVTCRYLKRDKLSHPPPLMEGEALASRILELGPVGAKFLGPVIIEVPHFGSLRGMEREIVILRSDNGETWREHTLEASEEAVHDVLNESFEGEELTALEETGSGRMTRILTTDFPQYFAVVSRIRQEVHAIGPEGGMVSSSVVPQVQAVFPQGALTKKIKVGLQAQPISAELAAKLLGNRVAVSPIVTVEPRRRKFHKPITLTIPVPQAANKGMINQYSGDAPTLRLLCSITGGTTRAQWEDVTGSTPLTFVNDCVSFTTTVSARFWLMDCRNIGEATKMATELYKEAIHVPFMAKFVVFAKRVDVLEARLRVFCMTDDKEDKTLEHQEHFTEVAKSRDVEVLEGKSQYIEFAGNLVPVTKSGDQLQLGFRAFRENRLPFTVRVKDPHADTVGRILFMREPKVAKGEPPQQPICILNIVLPETILPESALSEPDLLVLHKKYSFLRDGGLGRLDTTCQRTDLRLSDISNLLGEDWVPLASELGITNSDVNLVKSECPSSVAQQAMAMLRLWLQQDGNKATGYVLETALHKIGRDDIVQQCIFNVDEMDRAIAKVHLDQSDFESLKEELGPSRDASLRRDASLDITYDEQDIMKESESVEELVQAEKKEPYDDRLSKPVISKDRHEWDIDETKYIGEEKVVEEERKTVAQLKEIFAQDKRDRQYERQPPISEQLPAAPPVKHKKEKVSPPSMLEDICKVSATEDSIQVTPPVQEEVPLISKSTIEDGISTLEKDISKKQPSPPPSVRTEADQRRDSELFQGVTEELVRLETTCKVISAAEELMSPKLSKTPPPSPADFKDNTGAATWQQGDILTSTEKPLPAQEWTEKSQEKEKRAHTTVSGKSPTDVSSGDMVKTSPIIVGVMEKSVPKYDIKKEGFSKTGVESTLTTEIDHELQRISDEFISKEKKATEKVSPIRVVSEVTRKADTVLTVDKHSGKEVHEPSYLSDMLKAVGDELKETARDAELFDIRKDEKKVKDSEATNISETVIVRDVHDQVMKTECGITKLEGVVTDKAITSEELSDTVRDDKIKFTEDDAVVIGDLKGSSQENLPDRGEEVCKLLFSDENPDKEIISIKESKSTGVIDYVRGTPLVNFADGKIQKSEPLNSNDKSESEILKAAELINNIKDVSEEESEDTKIWDFKPRISDEKVGDISKVALQISIEEGGKDLYNTIEKEIKPTETTQPFPKVKEIQSETKPIVTTPTLSRRGLGGSQCLSRDQRPPPLDVSHLTLSSEEGTDEDFDAAGYIVTEPGDDDIPKQLCQENTIYRINSSPDILTEPPLRKVSSKSVPSVQVTDDVRDTLFSEVPIQIKEEVSVNEMAQVPQVQSDSDASEEVQKTGTSEQVYIQPETQHLENTKQTVQPSVSMEEVIEQPLMAFDTVTELQIPTLVPVEHYEGEVHRHKPMFRIESDDSTDQGMEDIEALIEKANRELALEMERAGLKVPDADDESDESDESPEEEESNFNVHIPGHEPETSEKEVVRTKESDSKEERKLRRVERRFERMASETLDKEAAAEGSNAPEIELRHEAEFERMVSQLSTEEVADCQREYSQLWDEGGLTPSEDWDSRDPDTPSGELEEDPTTASPSESTRLLTTELTDRQEPRVEEPLILHPTPSPRLVPKPEFHEDETSHFQTSQLEPVSPGLAYEVAPVSHIPVHRVSVEISPSEAVAALEDSKTDTVKPEGEKGIEVDVQSYSDRKKFWEQMTTGPAKTATETVIKLRTQSQEPVAPPVPKPRSSVPTPAPLISVLQESGIIKSEAESDTDTTTFSDSTIRMHPPPASVSKQSTFTGSSDTSDREGSETEATDVAMSQITGVPTTAPSAVAVFSQQHSHTEEEEAGSSDSEAEYLAKCVDKPLAYENTAFVGDDDGSSKPSSLIGSLDSSEDIPTISSKRALFEKNLEQTLPVAASRKVYERSVSLPTEDLIPFDQNGSVRAKKRYFEAQIKKEMVVEQLMTQMEEEASPEHKAIAQSAIKQSDDMEGAESRQIRSDIFTHELDGNTESGVPEDKNILTTVKNMGRQTQEDISLESGCHIGATTEVTKLQVGTGMKPTVFADVPDKYVQKPRHDTKDENMHVEVVQESAIISETKVSSVKNLAKEFEIQSPLGGQESTISPVQGIDKDLQHQVRKSDLQVDDTAERKAVKDIRAVFESTVHATTPQPSGAVTHSAAEEGSSKTEVMEMTSKITDIDLFSETREEQISDQLAQVLHYKTENVTKPSDSLEVHVDKSEIEETEKERDIEEEIKAMESCRVDDNGVTSIAVTLSGKQQTDSYSQGESEDTASESDVTPEEHPLYQPEEHIHDTVWEVPVQEQSESVVEIVQEIPLEKQIIVEKDEDENVEISETPFKISEQEARMIAEEVVESIEAEVARRSDLILDTASPPVPPPEMAESQVTEYLRQLAGKEELEPREVQLIESVLASKHREEMKKLARTDTTTSSMEITDEDLRSSGVETDLSPLDSQAGRAKADNELEVVSVKLQGEEVVEKTLAEVRESLEAAQEQLIEQHKKKEEVIQKKESPSEFEFKVLSFEKVLGESIEESRCEEVSATADYSEATKDGRLVSHVTDVAMSKKDEMTGESRNVDTAKIIVGKDGVQEIIDSKQHFLEERDVKTKKSKFEDVGVMRQEVGVTGEHRIFASFSDDEDRSVMSNVSETRAQRKGGVQATRIAEEKERSEAVSEEKLVIESKLEEEHSGFVYEKQDITRGETATVKWVEKDTKVEESTEDGKLKTELRRKTDSSLVGESKVETLSSAKFVGRKEDNTEQDTYVTEISRSEQSTEEAMKTEKKVEIKKSFKLDSGVPETAGIDQVMPTLTEGMELSNETVRLIEKEIKRTSSEESQRSLSQDESTKSPIDSSSSSGRRAEADAVRVIERPDCSEATVVVLRHTRHSKPDVESSSSGERSGSTTLRADRRSGADFEAWSSSGESHYHSFEQTSESGRTSSRPCSSDVEALMAGVGTAGSSEYESALTSQELSARSASHEYHTAVSSLSSRDSMKSLDSESSGHLASIEISSEASETLVPSYLELEKDMEGVSGALVMEDEDIELRELTSHPPVTGEEVDTNDIAVHFHVTCGELKPQQHLSQTYTDIYDTVHSTILDTSGVDKGETSHMDDGRQSPFEIISESEVLEYHGEDMGGSEDEDADIPERKEISPALLTDESGGDERPHCMKRSHEMIFQPEPRPIITDSPLSETATEERFGSSVEEGSILSVSLSSASDATGLRTVIELSRADSERMDASVTSEQLTVSGTSEQLSLEEIDPATLSGTQFVDSETCTYPTSTSGRELHLSSVTITTSSVDEYGVQSVCTQVTSQCHTPVLEDDDNDSQNETTERESGDDFPQSNGPTQVDYVPEYDDDYDDSRKRHMGHRRKESTSSFKPAILPIMASVTPAQVAEPLSEVRPSKFDTAEGVEDTAESDKYTETGALTLKEVRSDEKKDVDEAERLEEESYQTEADQGFHRDLREGRVLLEEVAGMEEDPEAELDTSRPQSQVSKSDSEGYRPMSSGFSDDRPDSELAELLKQCSEGGKELEDPIERPLSPEPADEFEIKDDTPEFSSEAQASVTELEMEYSGAFSRSVEYASHVSPIREERTGMQYVEACNVIEQPVSDREDDMAEAEAAFQMTPHVHPGLPPSLPATIPEDPAAEKHELETRDRAVKESRKQHEIILSSPASIPDITVTQHMTPLVDRGFHYPDLELEEEAAAAKSTPQTPASISSRASSETETDQGREYVLEEEEHDYIGEEPELEDIRENKHTEWRSMDETSATEDKTVYESEVKEDIKAEPASHISESPESDSFEMLEKPDLTDEYVVIEEVGREAEEHDMEGKSVQIQKKTRAVKKKHDSSEEELISSPPAPATRMTELKYYPEPGEDMGPFPFDSDSPPTAAVTKKSVGVRTQELGLEGQEGEYDRDVEAGKKWIEMQFQGDAAAAAAVAGYGYEMEFERGPLEDIKEEEVNDFDQSSSKVGSMGSYKGSIGSFGSVKESLSSTPEYDVLAGRKFFTRSGEHDDVSMSSLQEFEQLERQIALEATRKRSHGSQDSLNGNNKRYSHSGQGDDVSLSSLKEFEGLETACIEAAKIETRAKEEEALLSEIEEGHESQVSESESCETMSVGDGRGVLGGGGGESVDSDDYEKRMFEIDEIIRQAQSNVERFVDPKDDVTESVGRGDSLEEVARVPELDLDQPLYLFPGKRTAGWCEAGDDVMRTSCDSLDLKGRSSALHASTDSLDLKTVADVMTTSTDSIEFQMQLSGLVDIMTDSMELPPDSAIMTTSTDSLELGVVAATGVTTMTDSIEEEEEVSMLGHAEGQGSGSGGHDQSSSSGREGDLSSSGKDENSGEHGCVPPPHSDMMLGSTDSLEPSSSTATHATYQYETDSVMSSSFTSGGSNTMVSSTDTLDPTGAGGLDAIDLAAAARSAGVWFDDGNGSRGKPFVTEVIEPSEEDEFSHTIHHTVELPPEVRKVSFQGPDAERALRDYVEHFAPGEDVTETEEVDSGGNVHIKRVVQRRVVIRSEDMSDTELMGSELEKYLRNISSGEYEQASGEDVPESDYTHLMTSITGGAESFSSPPEVVTHHTYVTRHMIHPTPGAVVTTTTQQGITTTTPNLTAEEGAGTGDGDATQTLRQTTQTRTGVVDGETVTTTTTITAATKITKEQGDVQEHLEKSLDKDKSRKPE